MALHVILLLVDVIEEKPNNKPIVYTPGVIA